MLLVFKLQLNKLLKGQVFKVSDKGLAYIAEKGKLNGKHVTDILAIKFRVTGQKTGPS